MRPEEDKEDLERDPIAGFLREKLPATGLRPEDRPRPAWRTSWPRVGVACVLVAAGVTAAALAPLALREAQEASPGTIASGGKDAPAGHDAARKGPAAGRVVLVTIGVTLERDGDRSMPSAGDDLRVGDAIETGAGAAAGISIEGGHSVVLGPDTRVVMARGGRGPGAVGIAIERGTIAARTIGSFSIGFADARVTARDAVITAAARAGAALDRVTVEEGEAVVERGADERTWSVGRGKGIDSGSWSVGQGAPDQGLLGRLDAIVALTATADDAAAVAGAAPAAGKAPAARHGQAVVERIREALAEGDVTLAMDIVEAEGAGVKDADFLLAAAETYSEASEWSQAAQKFAAAAADADGKEAERALLKAAEIRLRKLGDPAGAASLLDDYLARFPAGAYRDEALFLAAAVQTKLGDLSEARGYYESYLAIAPDGAQAVRAHVALAQILALKLGDCKAAAAHVAALEGKATGPAVDTEIAKVEAACRPPEEQYPW